MEAVYDVEFRKMKIVVYGASKLQYNKEYFHLITW